jgi:anti-sigma B factor antagonist
MLTIDSGPDGSLRLVGRFDASQVAPAQAAFDRVAGTVRVDCAGLEYISSAGLGVLLKTQKRLAGAGGKLRLTSVSRHIRDIFVYSGFDQIFEIEGDANGR